ncbi:hypothetical protein GCM10017620_24840 [Brevundimonas intermedia]|uniref:Uncharacterized protein n=1 Tax=Brevundimonas intermedia TaxID=74315 RepID=A0ABQ5TCN0_9CAUL|nr:YdaS family helix-turn-helix protein [Brevundimonas intermedia]GLK49511.1 hypothetical protein GCM10017620_24840 [Brevundimonas intermedia]
MTGPQNPLRITALLEAAITIAGSEAKLGKATGYSQNAIWSAKRNGRVSAEMAAAIHRATNGAVAKHLLRPDIYSDQAATADRAAA